MKIIKTFIQIIMVTLLWSSCSKEEVVIIDPINDAIKEDHHPFLIVKEDQFSMMRERAFVEPWKSMKEDALKRAAAGSKTDAYGLQYYVGAAALAYILDDGNKTTHANRVRDAILNQYSQIELEDGSTWNKVVPPMSSFFVAILSLDIVYNSLSIADIFACEKVIHDKIFTLSRTGNWVDARYGTHGAWDIYKGERTTPDDDYYYRIMLQITDDGVSPVTNHYAWERVGGGNSRISKSGYMDVLEFTGIDQRYYNNEKLKKFHRWLFGSSVNCAKEMAIFGDMLPNQGISNDMLHRRVVNFDEEAAEYAAWFHQDKPAIGNIISYLIPDKALPAPALPQSQFYENGGAFFRESKDDPRGLHAVLYNIQTQAEWHTHNEVNGLALSGLGNRLLVNGGRLGEPTRAASLNNTLTVNGNNHEDRIGGGIVEGFVSEGLDYSSGFSGQSLKNASHYRNLVMVHGSDISDGYIAVFDEVEGNAMDVVSNYIHPANQSGLNTIEEQMTYEASIDHEQTVIGTHLTIFYATTPESIVIEQVEGAVPDRYPGYPLHSRIQANYTTDDNGQANLITVLSPFDSQVIKPTYSRLILDSISGGIIDHGNGAKDIIIASNTQSFYTVDDIKSDAKALLIRNTEEGNPFYFARHATHFMQAGIGFESTSPITIHSQGTGGIIISNGTSLKLIGPGIETVQFGIDTKIISSGIDYVVLEIPAGEARF